MSTFKVGDKVRWRSQANGRARVKVGTIVAVVLAGTLPPSFPSLAYAATNLGGSLPRNHDSYVVGVEGKTLASKPKLYWPRVSHLEKI